MPLYRMDGTNNNIKIYYRSSIVYIGGSLMSPLPTDWTGDAWDGSSKYYVTSGTKAELQTDSISAAETKFIALSSASGRSEAAFDFGSDSVSGGVVD